MSIQFGVLTISDRSFSGAREDKSGPALQGRLRQAGFNIAAAAIVPDEAGQIRKVLIEWCDVKKVEVVLTTGGTGFATRDTTPEATLSVIDKVAPGISEAIRAESLKITPHAMLSRGVTGIRGSTLIINLPGSPKGALESLEVVLPIIEHAVDLLSNNIQADRDHTKNS